MGENHNFRSKMVTPTVLGQNNRGIKNLHNSKGTPPIGFKLKLEVCGISTFFLEKKSGRPKKQHCCFCCFFEKIDLSKNTFFPSWQKFRGSKIEKKAKNHWSSAPRPQNNFGRTFGQNTWGCQKFLSGAPDHDFRPFFRKTVLWKTYFRIYDSKYGLEVEIWEGGCDRNFWPTHTFAINSDTDKKWAPWLRYLWRYTFLQKKKRAKC